MEHHCHRLPHWRAQGQHSRASGGFRTASGQWLPFVQSYAHVSLRRRLALAGGFPRGAFYEKHLCRQSPICRWEEESKPRSWVLLTHLTPTNAILNIGSMSCNCLECRPPSYLQKLSCDNVITGMRVGSRRSLVGLTCTRRRRGGGGFWRHCLGFASDYDFLTPHIPKKTHSAKQVIRISCAIRAQEALKASSTSADKLRLLCAECRRGTGLFCCDSTRITAAHQVRRSEEAMDAVFVT